MKKRLLFHVAAYVRLSREDGDKAESDSIGNQIKLIKENIRNHDDFILADTYVDDGFTGTNFQRPAFQRMITDIECGKINCVVVKDLSRFGRDYIDTGKYLERYFPDQGVRFISVTDQIDSQKQPYDMLLPIKNIFNEQYARDISKKVHASMKTKQKAGEFIGAFASYGYRKDPDNKNRLIVDDYAANVVRRIFDLYIQGYGKIRIASMLNEEGIVCPSEYKKLQGDNYRNSNRLNSTSYWTYSTINRILQNEMYIGNMVQGKTSRRMRSKAQSREREEWIIVNGTHEAIIDIDTWEKVQCLLKRRTRELDLNANTSIFAGFLKCGECGRALVKRNYYASANRYIKYFCGTYVRSGRQYCTPHTISHELLQKILLDDLRTIIQNIDDLRAVIEKQKLQPDRGYEKKWEQDRKRLLAELERVQKLKKNIYEDYREELLSREEFISYREDYISKEAILKQQIDSLDAEEQAGQAEDVFNCPWVKRLMELKTIEELDRNIVVEMVHDITVYENNRIQITYNFSNDLENLFQVVYQQSTS